MLRPSDVRKILYSEKNKQFLLPTMLIVAGVFLLIVISSPKTSNKNEDTINLDRYVSALESNLEKNIKKLSSVNDCSVMITVSSLDQNEYLENQNVSSSLGDDEEEYIREKEYLVIESGGEDTVVMKVRKMPEIRGALIVYEGENDINIKMNILKAATTILGIKSNKVCVVSSQE